MLYIYSKFSRHTLDYIFLCLFTLSTFTMLLTNDASILRDSLCGYSDTMCFYSSNAESINIILYDLSVGGAISLIFYALLVRLPALQRRSQIKRSFRGRYKNFKISCIEIILLVTNNSYSGGEPEGLLDQKKFRAYFKENATEDQERWDVFLNNLCQNEYYLKLLVSHLDVFRDEISYVLNNSSFRDDEVFNFLKRLSEIIYLNRDVDPDFDNLKSLSQFFWQIFAGWSFVDGYSKRDIIEEMIDSI